MVLLVLVVVGEVLLLVDGRRQGAERDLVARRRQDVGPVTAHGLTVCAAAAKPAGMMVVPMKGISGGARRL